MLPKALLQGPSRLADVTPKALVTKDGVHHSISQQFWNRVVGVDQLLCECPKWMESGPDVKVAEHSVDRLGTTHGCTGWLQMFVLSVSHPGLSGGDGPLHKSSWVAIVLQCFLQLLFFLGSSYT